MRSLAFASAGAAVVALARRRYLRWGSTAEELARALPGDDLVPDANITATRAISVAATAETVWPWIAQLGQGRGGFYSYDFLENLAGCDIHSADRVVPEWQSIAVGDEVKLHPEIGLRVAVLRPGTALVLRGGIPMGPVAPPYDCTWAFIVHAHEDGTTRLVVRERYEYTRWWSSLLVEPVQLISFIMSQRMLRGVKQRAERTVVCTSEPRHGVTAQ
jgi:NAD(P)-dependent dehydrogenase (short-subunit alcohol dehydrogenase family)